MLDCDPDDPDVWHAWGRPTITHPHLLEVQTDSLNLQIPQLPPRAERLLASGVYPAGCQRSQWSGCQAIVALLPGLVGPGLLGLGLLTEHLTIVDPESGVV